jgi:hypothetical protein
VTGWLDGLHGDEQGIGDLAVLLPLADQLGDLLLGGGEPAGRRPGALPDEGPGDLEGEQRVALRDPVQPQQDGTRELPAGSSSQEAGHRLPAQRGHRHPVQARCRTPCPRPSGSPPEPVRRATRNRIGASSRRRTTNASTLAESGSSHWTSSIATTTGPAAASARSTPATRPTPPAGPVGRPRPPLGGERRPARASAGRADRAARSRRGRRAPRTRAGPPTPPPRQDSTRCPRARARDTPARHNVVLPIPAAPSRSRAEAPPGAGPRKDLTWASSRRDQSKYLVGLGIGDLDGRLS